MIPPELLAALSGPEVLSLPEPLPVQKSPGRAGTFTPRTVHFPRDHRFFEV